MLLSTVGAVVCVASSSLTQTSGHRKRCERAFVIREGGASCIMVRARITNLPPAPRYQTWRIKANSRKCPRGLSEPRFFPLLEYKLYGGNKLDMSNCPFWPSGLPTACTKLSLLLSLPYIFSLLPFFYSIPFGFVFGGLKNFNRVYEKIFTTADHVPPW